MKLRTGRTFDGGELKFGGRLVHEHVARECGDVLSATYCEPSEADGPGDTPGSL